MKKILVLVAAMILSSQAFAIVVGKVDVQKVIVSVNEGKKIKDQLKGTFDEKQKILKKEEDKIRKMQEAFKKQSLVMNEKAKQQKQMEIQESIVKLQQKTAGYQREIQELEQKFKKPLFEKIKVVISDISKKAGVDFTIESATAPIIYAKTEKDLTDEVIKAFNSKHK
ncbi:OmpH family outer membrane protein [Halobacteriovorax sp. HLS]|uniref:OmpH family outer membrane protein n=1 Tax=Halobacteriovorax sp. HLS TaxID=2234000 RepID=UPI000FD83E45|nr:OmpH family outer membrane protein [Halobacteriovorax sp. HLS]